MGLKPWEIRRLRYKDYSDMVIGDMMKRAESFNLVRMVETAIINFSGFGGRKKMVTPQEVRRIPVIDNIDVIIPIRSKDEALQLLNRFKAWQD